MAEVYFLGDCHFGHRNILEYRKRFKTIKEHDDFIINNINRVVTKRDKLILTGDTCFGVEALETLKRIKCPNIHFVFGNHDDYNIDFKKEVPNIQWVSGDFKYKEFWVSHIPLHAQNLRERYNIHAHLHEGTVKDWRYIGTSCEQVGYTPISLQQIRANVAGIQPKAKKGLLDLLLKSTKKKAKKNGKTAIPVVHGNVRKSGKR